MYAECMALADSELTGRKLFVRNLSYDVEEAALREVVSEFGEISECMVR